MAKTIKGSLQTQSNVSWQPRAAPGAASHCLFIATLAFKVHAHCSPLITNKLQFLCMRRLKANYLWGTGPEEGEKPLAKWLTLRPAQFYRLLDPPDRACIIQRFGEGIVAPLDIGFLDIVMHSRHAAFQNRVEVLFFRRRQIIRVCVCVCFCVCP